MQGFFATQKLVKPHKLLNGMYQEKYIKDNRSTEQNLELSETNTLYTLTKVKQYSSTIYQKQLGCKHEGKQNLFRYHTHNTDSDFSKRYMEIKIEYQEELLLTAVSESKEKSNYAKYFGFYTIFTE